MQSKETLKMEEVEFVCRKVKYASEEFALFDIHRIKIKSSRKIIPTRVYFCRCGSWHLTSRMDNKQVLISKLQLENHQLKLKVEELTKMNQEGLSELDKNERLELRRDKMLKEFKKGLKTTQTHNKALYKTNSELIHKNLMLENKLKSLESKKTE